MAERAEYRIVSLLGEGATGRVELAQAASGQLVALKTVHPHLAAERSFRELFRREATAAHTVGGPFTAAVVDGGIESGQPWLATEFCVGPALVETVTTLGPLDPPSLGTLGTALTVALSALHAAGLVHRELKPAHVIVTRGGPKVIGFGAGYPEDATGPLGFVAPEQLTPGAQVGPPADVFGLGVLLALSSTGRNPHGSGGAEKVLLRTLHEAPDLIGVPGPQWPGFIAHCLAKSPADRPTVPEALAWCAGQAAAVPWWEEEPMSGVIREHEDDVTELLGLGESDPEIDAATDPDWRA
ncbi:serine/threonine-protein kinase [Streptomyces sp. A5-4]|uniref:serine/threonine-protein kinase n=1 Tax=Streptomyces sp. A5-4 TaxID=3384771 RepID=UPI003DA9CB5E